MNQDTNKEMVDLDVKISIQLRDEIDEHAEELGYANRSEFVRDLLNDVTDPILTPGAMRGLAKGYADLAAGRTMSPEEVKSRLGIDEE